jgi:hypothetical protein
MNQNFFSKQLLPSYSGMLLIFVLAVCLSGCNQVDQIPTDINQVKVKLYESDPVNNRTGLQITSQKDSAIASRFSLVQAESDRTFEIDPPVTSNDVQVKQVAYRSGTLFVSTTSRSGDLKLIDNSRECSERGFLGLFCKSWYQHSNFTVLVANGGEYKIRGWDNSSAKETFSDAKLVFEGVSPSALSEFRLRGVGWESGSITLGVSKEESNAIEQLKQEIRSAGNELSLRSIAILINRQSNNAYATQVLIEELLSRIVKTNDPLAYSTVIDLLNDKAISASPRVKELGVGFLDAVYSTTIKGTNDTVRFANFLSNDGQQLPPEKFDNVFNQGVALEVKKIESVLSKLDSIGQAERLWLRVKGESSIDERKEKFLRSVYAAALEEKRNNRVIRSMMIYKALLESRGAVGASAIFELQRDQEMREFLTGQFEKIRAQASESSQKLTAAVRSMSSELNQAISKVSENTSQIIQNTAAVQESRAEEQARNVRMTQDMFFENRYLERAHGR